MNLAGDFCPFKIVAKDSSKLSFVSLGLKKFYNVDTLKLRIERIVSCQKSMQALLTDSDNNMYNINVLLIILL